ncbi:MAG: TlpA disulfide reductase family protein [Endomicrobiia bacterium]
MIKTITTILVFTLLMTDNIYSQQKENKSKIKYIDFEAQQLSSTETFKLSSFVGKKLILLNFWTTWCPYCVAEVPHLIELYNKYKDKGLEILAINIGEPKNKVENFVVSQKIPYRVLLDLHGKVAKQYGVRGIPTNFLINKSGEVIFVGYDLPDLSLIEKNLLRDKDKKDTEKKRSNKN